MGVPLNMVALEGWGLASSGRVDPGGRQNLRPCWMRLLGIVAQIIGWTWDDGDDGELEDTCIWKHGLLRALTSEGYFSWSTPQFVLVQASLAKSAGQKISAFSSTSSGVSKS